MLWHWELLLRKQGANPTLPTFLGRGSKTKRTWTSLFVPRLLRLEPMGKQQHGPPFQCAAVLCALAPLNPQYQHPQAPEPVSLLMPSPELWCISFEIWAVVRPCYTSPSVSKEMGGGASWLRNCFANGSIFVQKNFFKRKITSFPLPPA